MKEIGTTIKESWNKLKNWAIGWFKNNIFDIGSGPVGIGDTGEPTRIFGFAIPSLAEVNTVIKEKWSTLKTWAIGWFTKNIWEAGVGDKPSKLFGISLEFPDINIPVSYTHLTLPTILLV